MLSAVDFAKLKLARVSVHLREINGVLRGLVEAKDTYEILRDANGKETLHFLVDAPSDLHIISGEIVYQFKSALDHLAFALVQSNPRGVKLLKGWERTCQFPLHLTVPTYGSPPLKYPVPVPYQCFEKKLPGISDAAYAFIESVQPYHRGPGVHNILRIIEKLANVDKHKHPYALLPTLSLREDSTHSNGITGMSVRGGFKHGAEIPLPNDFPGEPPVHTKRSFTPYITFDKTIGEGPDTLGAEDVLQVCLEQFETVIIPAFDRLIQ
jgi:hypothetical protein